MGIEVPFPFSAREVPFPLQGQGEDFETCPPSQTCRKINFDEERVEIRPGFAKDTWFLLVTGMKPYTNMRVELVPVMYVKRPEFWQIEVVGCLPGIGLTALAPYSVFVSLEGVIGTKGIEIMGATKSKKLFVPPNT